MAQFSTPDKSYPKYKDFWVKIAGSYLCAHVIEMLGRDESMLLMMTKQFYYIDVGSGFVIAFIVWTLLSLIIRWLDKYFDWTCRTLQRIFLQFFLAVILPSFAVHFLTYLQGSYLIEDSSFFTSTWATYELPVCIMLIILVNAYYLLYYYYLELQRVKELTFLQSPIIPSSISTNVSLENNSDKVHLPKKQVILVSKGYKTYPLTVSKIAYFFKEERYTYITTFDNEKYFIDNSLEEILEWLETSILPN